MTPCSFTDDTNVSEDHSGPVFRAKYCNLECNFSVTTEFNLAVAYQHFGRSCCLGHQSILL